MPPVKPFLGLWEGDDLSLSQTASEDTGAGDDAGIPSDVRFQRAVLKLIRARKEHPDSIRDSRRPAVFLLAPPPLSPPPVFFPLLDCGQTPLMGRAWFINSTGVSGNALELPEVNDQEVFRWVVDDLSLGSVPAVLVVPGASSFQLRYYSHGLAHHDTCTCLALSDCDISLDEVFTVIDHIHAETLVTPCAQSEAVKIWKDSYPLRKAEKIIQACLRAALAGRFMNCNIQEEQSGTTGRYDLCISSRASSSGAINHILLELKALRSHGETGTPYKEADEMERVKEGVEQAYAYREERKVRDSALCCFDLRTVDSGNACFGHVRDLAIACGVSLRRWYLYSTAEAYRSAKAAAQLASFRTSKDSASSGLPPS